MGQGTESCGGYEVDYDPYEEGLDEGTWTTREGDPISVTSMTNSHLKNSIRLCKLNAKSSGFSNDEDLWLSWVELFQSELDRRLIDKSLKPKKPVAPKPVAGLKREMECHCGAIYMARVADLSRGWGKSCSKSCAAIRRKYGRKAAEPTSGVKQIKIMEG